MINQGKTKNCTKCKVKKEITEFGKDRSKKDGLTSACRKCNIERERKRKANGGNFTKKQKEAVFNRDGRFCRTCGRTNKLEVEHKLAQIICNPKTASVEGNAWILCKPCNISKGNRILLEVIATVPREVLGPMLLKEFANRISKGRFEKVLVTIGEKLFTEVKLK